MRNLVLGFFFLAACGASGTHGTEAVGSCSHRDLPGDAGFSASYLAGTCYEYDGPKDTIQGYSTNCGMGGSWSDQPCDHSGAIGGCEMFAMGLYYTVWWYSPQWMAKDAQAACGGTWLSP